MKPPISTLAVNNPLAHRVLLISTAAALLACAGCGSQTSPERIIAAKPAPATTTAASTNPSSTSDTARDFTTTAPIVTENEVELVSRREGVVRSVNADLGMRVHKGEVLAILDDRELRASYEAALAKSHSLEADLKNWEAELKVAQADEVRSKALYESQLLTKEQYEHDHYKTIASQFEVERQKQDQANAEHAAEAAALELEKTHIVAPFDGVVARRYVRVGEHVNAADRLFWIVGDTPLRVHFMIPEAQLAAGHIKSGAAVELASIYAPQSTSRARIIAVSPAVDPATASVEVVAEVTSPHGDALKPGMTAQITIPRSQK